jgi:CBS domain-containing protein
MLASFGGGTFAVLAPGLSEAEAAVRAEQLRAALAEAEFACGAHTLHMTCSVGVTAVQAETAQTADDVLQQAGEALQVARSAGRNCVVRFTELEEDAKVCAEFAVPGKVFERTVARDIMTPCPCVLRASEPAVRAAQLLRRTQLDAIAVVDGRGKLLGLATDHGELSDLAEGDDNAVKIGDVMLKDIPTYTEDTSLATLSEFFRHDAREHVVITRDRRPLGIVTSDSLVALGSKLTTHSFSPSAPFSPTSQYLVVSDLHAVAETRASR